MQAVKLRYLNAMGIESWVRRSHPVAVLSPDHEAEAAESVVEEQAEEPVATVRSLLDSEVGATPQAASSPRASAADDSASTPAQPASGPQPEPGATPEFRMRVLHLAGSVLLVDEVLLDPGALQAEQMHLLGDLLRCAHLLVHGDATGSIEHQVFYWPQVDDATLDQGLPRAREALAYHLRSRLQGGNGPVLHVSGEVGQGSVIARDSMAELAATLLEIDPELLDLQAPGKVRAQAWVRLRSLEAAAPETGSVSAP